MRADRLRARAHLRYAPPPAKLRNLESIRGAARRLKITCAAVRCNGAGDDAYGAARKCGAASVVRTPTGRLASRARRN